MKLKGLSKKEIERLFGKQEPSPYYKAGYNAYIKKVRVLKGDYKKQAKIMGLKGNDLVLITSRIEKVEGSPTDFMLKRCKKREDE